MAEFASGQGEANPAFWFATREGKMGPSGDFPRWSRKKKFSYWPHNVSLIDQLVRSRWLWLASVFFLLFYWPRVRLGLQNAKRTWSKSSHIDPTLGWKRKNLIVANLEDLIKCMILNPLLFAAQRSSGETDLEDWLWVLPDTVYWGWRKVHPTLRTGGM